MDTWWYYQVPIIEKWYDAHLGRPAGANTADDGTGYSGPRIYPPLRAGTADSRFSFWSRKRARLIRTKTVVAYFERQDYAKETLEPCGEPWTDHLPGNLYNSSRLYVLQFRESLGIVAVLFSEPPPPDMVQIILTSLNWFPPGTWRRWCCYDITFETPPNYAIHKAVFNPGRFHLTFTKGSEKTDLRSFGPGQCAACQHEPSLLVQTKSALCLCRQHHDSLCQRYRGGHFYKTIVFISNPFLAAGA